ncbi:MAG TPA: filamentous hemagglutinin family protein [Rhizomicrobium sp.]|jgi:filamentous hemagglutinin family protein
MGAGVHAKIVRRGFSARALMRASLLRGASVFALGTALSLSGASAETAATIRAIAGLAAAAAPKAPTAPTQTTAQQQGMSTATMRALMYQAHINQAADLAKQAQAAARAAAAQISVPDGLGTGGLDPVKFPEPAAQDATGLNTWQGAQAPTQTKTSDGAANVTIKQTDSRAILSWQTFNVGKKTTLTFDQTQNGTAQPDWIVLNRVVGQIDPATGLRDPNATPAPSLILGSIKANGTVLILNQNGVVFGATAQVNTHGLIATSLEIGRATDSVEGALTIKQRDDEFLNFGLLGFADQAGVLDKSTAFTFSAQATGAGTFDPMLEGTINVQAGAQIATDTGGYVLLTGPKVINSGHIVSPQGEVALQAGREVTLERATGAADSDDPNVRGFTISALARTDAAGNYVDNTSTGWIEAPQGFISLAGADNGAVIQEGLLQSTTSVSRNGYIALYGGDIKIASTSTMSILPDDSGQTIPQDPVSLTDFKSSKISIGNTFSNSELPVASRIEIDGGSMIYAPGADVQIGSKPGLTTLPASVDPGGSRIFVDSGAIIDVAGLTDVLIPASRNSIEINPVTDNELQDTPTLKGTFLDGATIFVDPRFSGVRADGVTWIGSPLVSAGSYYQQVGVTAEELMTKGGNITMSVASAAPVTASVPGVPALVPDIIVKPGAIIDMSGGWVTYQAGFVQTTKLIDSAGQVVDISAADPRDTYVGIATGYVSSQPRWGITDTWANPLLTNGQYESAYTEGRDAGSLIIRSSSVVLDGTLYGQAYAGSQQLVNAQTGTATSTLLGDKRALQAAPSQLPAGAYVAIEALGKDPTGNITGGGDVSITATYTPLDTSFAYGQSISIDPSGNLIQPVRDPASVLTPDRQDTILLSADALSAAGLSQLTINTSGSLTVSADAHLSLTPGGVFDATAGRKITVDGTIKAASGKILLETVNAGIGNIFVPQPQQLPVGSFDVVVNGTLSTRGLWTNDFNVAPGDAQGGAYIDGGTISIISAPRVSQLQETASVSDSKGDPNKPDKPTEAPQQNVDISGSILIDSGSVLDVSGGGYVRPDGSFDLSGHGGNLSLIDDTNYFQLADDTNRPAGGLSGFRVSTILNSGGTAVVAVNPDQITSHVAIDGTILAEGFAGGGTFTLDAPEVSFGDPASPIATALPLDFFSRTGFANYDITSYKTDLIANPFNNNLGGYNAVLATQVLTVGDGQTLSLVQSQFSPILSTGDVAALRGLSSGGDLYSVMTPAVPADAWDQKAVNLTLGGTTELHVAAGGTVTGAAGAVLTVSQLYNEGTIRIAGGQIVQSEVLPAAYVGTNAIGLHDLADAFTLTPAGLLSEKGPNALGIKGPNGAVLTNAQLASQYRLYLLGDLDQGEGVRLAAGSTTDLSGTSILNPRAPATGFGNTQQSKTGIVVAGGTLESLTGQQFTTTLFHDGFGVSVFNSEDPIAVRTPDQLNANSGSVLNLSGAADSFDQLQMDGSTARTPVWSNAGTLALGNGGTLTGALIDAHGGAAKAEGGTLVMLDPVLTQDDPNAPAANVISAAAISDAGFTTLVVQGSVTSDGDVTLNLGRAFFLTSAPVTGLNGQDLNNSDVRDSLVPTIGSGGVMEIDAPYIGFDSDFQAISAPAATPTGTDSAIFRADTIGIQGAVATDSSVSDLELFATHDVSLTGVQPWQHTFNISPETVENSLSGMLAVSGNLSITAGQIYPTTGSTFTITSSAPTGVIAFARSSDDTPAPPISAGGSLTVQAAQIVQGGVIRAPLGQLTLGGSSPLNIDTGDSATTFAPATTSVELLDGSITSVSAKGLMIPYGTTTDQTEWFFEPTGSNELTAPPAASLTLGGASVSLDKGSTVDVSGGGDIYAYEFIPGAGGSRDILNQFNADPFSSQNGFQYPDGRQVYAIVPGLSNNTAAAFDPIYSSGYSDLYSASDVGKSVYLTGAPGLAAGWYTLLPAQYATLLGGLRVVEQSATSPLATGSGTLNDGSLIVTGFFGDAASGAQSSTVDTFSVMAHAAIGKYSDIALTSGDAKFAADAAKDGLAPPPLPIDAGRLILDPSQTLTVDTDVLTAPAEGGRGAQADISGLSFDIVSTLPDTLPTDGTIVLTADSLSNLNASSLLIGGVRTDNADGTTSLEVSAHSIVVENDTSHPLQAPEIVLAVDGLGSSITVKDGADVEAQGAIGDTRTGDYLISGQGAAMTGQGALLRVSTGPQRQVTRTNLDSGTPGMLSIGNATVGGTSLLLDSSGGMQVSSGADLNAKDLAIGAGKVSFTDNPDVTDGLVITSQLQSLFGKADQLVIRSPNTIDFSSGSYTFGNLSLDTPGLSLLDGTGAKLTTGTLSLANSSAAGLACDATGAPACGTGSLSIIAQSINFGSGTVRTYGFGGGVSLTAANGISFNGVGTLDAGPAALSIATPYISDAANPILPDENTIIPSLTLETTGAVSISNPDNTATTLPSSGTPGASLTISGNSVDVSGARLHATSGLLKLTAVNDIDVTGGAILETPGFAETLGDSADPVSVSAPGGTLALTSQSGSIDLAQGTTVSIGGGKGEAGTLALVASKGNITLDSALDADAPKGNASLTLDALILDKVGLPQQPSAFDLASIATLADGAFTGTIDIRTGTGDLDLASGETFHAQNVSLTADGGKVDIAGTIDVSGISGGDVSLFGQDGVTFENGAKIDAHANGYGATDTRQAKGGDVEIGTAGDGMITVASGALIDVGAGGKDRLVPEVRNGVTYYAYVPADQGGTVLFRAPVTASCNDVNVFYDGTIRGAGQVVVEGYKAYDLDQMVNDPNFKANFVGISINSSGQAVLDLSATGTAGQSNFLADYAAGSLVQFVQDFDISGANSHLGGLTTLANFHERPGVQLDYTGDIVLNSNWNLGAGTVDVAGAVAAGLMAQLPSVPGKYYVLPGDEAAVFARFTHLIYRTGGAVDGEPGDLSLRAGGNLIVNGSISDGFFQFRDQTDPDYLNISLGGGQAIYSPYLQTACFGGTCNTIANWVAAGVLPQSFISISVPPALNGLLQNFAPYSAAANSPAALGSLAGNTGDPLGSAEMFPRLPGSGTTSKPVESWSYNLTGGANLGSADPLLTDPASSGNVIVQGMTPYTYAAQGKGTSSYDDNLLLTAGSSFVTPEEWQQAFIGANPSLDADSYTFLNLQTAPAAVRDFLINAAPAFFAQHGNQYELEGTAARPTGISTTLALAAEFMSEVLAPNFDALKSNFRTPAVTTVKTPTTAFSQTLVRTGTGSINVAAAQDIDLRNGNTPLFRKVDGTLSTEAKGGLQVGGTAIYTAGAIADLAPRTIVDSISQQSFTIDPTADIDNEDIFALPLTTGYRYGAGGTPDVAGAGYSGIFIANPVYAEDGGDVNLTAGRDVLGRRNVFDQGRLATFYDLTSLLGYDWIGTSDQAWRSGTVGMDTSIRIDPQLFSEGVGALGGGDVSVQAGRDVSDLSVVSDTSVTTATVQSGKTSGQALWTVGGGNVAVSAGRNIVGGRVDVASGTGTVSAGGDIVSDGTVQIDTPGDRTNNDLRIRVSDASVSVSSLHGIVLDGISALGVKGTSSDFIDNLDGRGFFSNAAGVSLLSNAAISVDNTGTDVITPSDKSTALTLTAVWPGTFEATTLTGDLTLTGTDQNAASGIFLVPSPTGELQLLAGGDITPVTIAMDDGDPGLLPGVFSSFQADVASGVTVGRTFVFPAVLPSTSDVDRRLLHNETPTHEGDTDPVRVYAGGDITDMILSVPKAARVSAGRDLTNMMFFGQNLSASDITRIWAGRDITATTELERPLLPSGQFGEPLAALQGNTFIVGGPGSFFLEAGRNAGPFLNSANVSGFETVGTQQLATGELSYAGGVQSVGNDWNPWLVAKGADLYVEFGVAKGADFDALRDYYLNPANLPNLDGDLFKQVEDGSGNLVPDRSQPIYEPILIQWMQNNAANQLLADYGTTKISFEQAYDAFKQLPELQQRVFLVGNVYFNELKQTSIPTGPSFKQYSRGYLAINLLFPGSLGYTQNDLSGGSNGATTVVQTGDLDLRLSTIETTRGGNIYILGPGGRVLAGSTVSTSQQAARRAYDGGRLFTGNANDSPIVAAITAIPAGFEGILTLRGGSISTFTDTDFLLNQSRLFTENGGDIEMWSSNGNLNAGQGPKTSANFPPVVVKVDEDLFSEDDQSGSVTGAGIAAFEPTADVPAPDVFLIAPRGTVDAGDAGVRVAGNLFVAAQSVAHSTGFTVSGTASGLTGPAGIDVNLQSSAGATSAAAAQAAQAATAGQNQTTSPSIITVDVLGYFGGDTDDDEKKRRHGR